MDMILRRKRRLGRSIDNGCSIRGTVGREANREAGEKALVSEHEIKAMHSLSIQKVSSASEAIATDPLPSLLVQRKKKE